MVGGLLGRGMLCGILAGVLSFAFAWVFGEPQVNLAIAFEAHHHAGEAEPELVSRSVQSTIGLFTGVVTYGAAFGGLFALVFAFALGRLGLLGPRGVAALLALAAFVVLILVPQLKYPANPPSIGEPETIGMRTALYFGEWLLSLVAATAAFSTGRSLVGRLGPWNAALVGGLAYLVAMAAAGLVLPTVDEVPDGFSAVLLWRFRLSSLGVEAVLWTALGLTFGAVAERYLAGRRRAAPRGVSGRVA